MHLVPIKLKLQNQIFIEKGNCDWSIKNTMHHMLRQVICAHSYWDKDLGDTRIIEEKKKKPTKLTPLN